MFKAISLSSLTALGLAALYSPAALADCTTDTDNLWECLEIETAAGSGVYVDHSAHTHMDGPLTFQGYADLSHTLAGTLTDCTLTVIGAARVDTTANRAFIEVSNATSQVGDRGDADCGRVRFTNFNWLAYEPGTTDEGINGQNHGDVYDMHGAAPGMSSTPPNHPHNAFGDLAEVVIEYRTVFNLWVPICSGTLHNVEYGTDVTGTGNKNNASFFRFEGSISGWAGTCAVAGVVTTDGTEWGGGPFRDVNAW